MIQSSKFHCSANEGCEFVSRGSQLYWRYFFQLEKFFCTGEFFLKCTGDFRPQSVLDCTEIVFSFNCNGDIFQLHWRFFQLYWRFFNLHWRFFQLHWRFQATIGFQCTGDFFQLQWRLGHSVRACHFLEDVIVTREELPG